MTVAPWKFGTTGGKPTWFTDAGAEVTHSKGKGVTCTRCDAPPQRVTTTTTPQLTCIRTRGHNADRANRQRATFTVMASKLGAVF